MCTTVDFSFPKQSKDENNTAYLKQSRIDFVDKLTEIPIKYYNLKRDDIPKGLLRSPTVKNYQKFIYAAFSFCPRYFLLTVSNALLTKPLRELKMDQWVRGIEKDDYDIKVSEESKAAVERLKEWQEYVKSALEMDFAQQTLEGDTNAKWFTERRFNKKYSEKMMLAMFQAEAAKAAQGATDDKPLNINFTLA